MCEAASAGDPCYSFEKNTKRRHEDANEGEAPTDTNAHERNTRTQNIPGRSFIWANDSFISTESSPSSEWTLMKFQECQPNSKGSLASDDPLEMSERPLCSERTLPSDLCFEWPLGTPRVPLE